MLQAKKRRVTFRLHAPEATEVYLVGDFNDWNPRARKLKKCRSGVWRTWTALPPGTYQYRFLVDGTWRNDPTADCVTNVHGTENCVVHVE